MKRSAYLSFPKISEFFSPYGKPTPESINPRSVCDLVDPQDALRKIETLISSATEDDARQSSGFVLKINGLSTRQSRNLLLEESSKLLTEIDYRLFDRRYTIFDRNVFVHRRERLNSHMRS